jgi:hypothetical protein
MTETDQGKLLELLAGVTISQADLAALVKGMAGRPLGAPSPDSVPDVPEEPYVQAGELWLLGGHRLRRGTQPGPRRASQRGGDPAFTRVPSAIGGRRHQ